MKYLLLVALLLLPACGFEPVYGEHEQRNAGAALPGIRVDVVSPDPTRRRMADQFQAKLEDLLAMGGRGQEQYRLAASLVESEVSAAVSKDGTISRYNVIISTDMTLIRLADGQPVYKGQAQRISSYDNVSGAFFSTYVSSQDAIRRGSNELAEDIRLRLAAFFEQNPNPAPIAPPPSTVTDPSKLPPMPPLSLPNSGLTTSPSGLTRGAQ